jgi:hypothetical protein
MGKADDFNILQHWLRLPRTQWAQGNQERLDEQERGVVYVRPVRFQQQILDSSECMCRQYLVFEPVDLQ